MLAQNGNAVETIGSSLDLFAGQAVDRLGVKLGFSFPAGVYVSDLAANCTENIGGIKVSVNGTYCNLSGLENQALAKNMFADIVLNLLPQLGLK